MRLRVYYTRVRAAALIVLAREKRGERAAQFASVAATWVSVP